MLLLKEPMAALEDGMERPGDQDRGHKDDPHEQQSDDNKAGHGGHSPMPSVPVQPKGGNAARGRDIIGRSRGLSASTSGAHGCHREIALTRLPPVTLP